MRRDADGRRPWSGAVVATAVALLAIAAERGRWFHFDGGDGPSWIWLDVDTRAVEPIDFYLVGEFELAEPPSSAVLEVLADESYLVLVNGSPVGSGEYRGESVPDRYAVGRYLRRGRNRILAELRSSTGPGGFWCRLEAADGANRTLIRSDESWTSYRSHWRQLLQDLPLVPGSPAKVLGPPPIGGWGRVREGIDRPDFDEVFPFAGYVQPRRLRDPQAKGPWTHYAPHIRGPAGDWLEFDFGRPVIGYFEIYYRGDQKRKALLRFRDRPEVATPGWIADDVVATMPRKGSWREAVARRFRFVDVVGFDGIMSVDLVPIFPAMWTRLPRALQIPQRGLFGVELPPLRSPVENEIWREVEGGAGIAVGEPH